MEAVLYFNFLPDILALCCLFGCGFYFGYYCKFTYIYDNLWTHWYSVVAISVSIVLASAWTIAKYRSKRYRFEHFYIVFYGLVCFLISCCFMLTDNLDTSFYFGFIGISSIYVPCFSLISMRSNSQGWRSANVALGNTCYFGGMVSGFVIFNEFEPLVCGWICLGLTLACLLGIVINELLQYIGCLNYKMSRDVVFNLVNDEKIAFVPSKSVFALFAGRTDFHFVRNRQWLVVGIGILLCIERAHLYSISYLQLAWSATLAFVSTQELYMPMLLHTLGCGIGCLLLMRYKAQVIYVLFGLIKITATIAVLGIYSEDKPDESFLFLCFYYITMGTYSSIAIQTILESTPFLFTELMLSIALSIEYGLVEALKYEIKIDSSPSALLCGGIASTIVTALCMMLLHFFHYRSEGLIDIRNYLLGIRRHPTPAPLKPWNTNFFQHHNLHDDDVSEVKLNDNAPFQQYPRE